MRGLMMEYQLTLPTILRRAETLFGKKEIVTRLPDQSIHRYTYQDFAKRSKKLAVALQNLGIGEGDRVATLSWNHFQHLEAYYAIPCIAAVVHPLNLRLSPEDLGYIVNHAEDKIIIVDQVLLPLLEKFKAAIKTQKIIVIPQTGEPIPKTYLNYEEVVASGVESRFEPFEKDEYAAAFLCYTSGTTGKPKGILYSHRSIVLHAMSSLFSCCGIGITERDVVLPVVPMFHASAWGLPYNCTLAGATQVFPGPYLDADSLLELFEKEKVTITAGVPTVMLGILNKLDAAPGKHRLCLRTILVGGSATPRFLVNDFKERHGLDVLSSWGMTELSPMGSTAVPTSRLDAATKEQQLDHAIKPGFPTPFVEIRGRNESGLIPWDGQTMGELEVRGPWVAASYYGDDQKQDKFTADGWLRTGDIVAISEDGCIEIKDRSKDVIKSGGEWISSIALEITLMAHPAVLEAAVIAIPDKKWIERPFAYVVLKEGKTVSTDKLKDFLAGKFAKFWVPDGFAFIDAIPRTSVGKFLKSALRERYAKENPSQGHPPANPDAPALP
ncbi:MAG TPA: long-chain fatty acid--CoA ligase [Puia sp.]|uniref:long-chain fatty acid--CoA ligase n=1 Tax=Puia sp. TaxID=2045100 RepID=UPI002CCD2CA1|nr:long-chain fatty acid--CoA ligase [Puia sp.]HVU98607.1 long-chain fatty acid--CoA ligase [Puia sp.]